MAQPRLTFLLDTNELIPLEPFGAPAEADIATLVSRANQFGHRVVVHPANRDDLNRNADVAERTQKLAALAKYEMLQESPISTDLELRAGSSEAGSNDHRDLRLLAALDSGAATYLVTEDRRLRARATRCGISQSVTDVIGALELLETLHPRDATPPPTVELVAPYAVDITQGLFDSLRDDYPEFEMWFKQKVAPDAQGRRCWVVKDADGRYDAIAIVKVSDDDPEGVGRPSTKLSTFKVAPHRAGDKVGELLLRTVLEWSALHPLVERIFVEVKPDKEALTRFLTTFGFEELAIEPRANGDHVYLKSLVGAPGSMSPFDFHVKFGPPAIDAAAPAFVIPIQPQWYFGLFPDSPTFGRFGGLTLGDGAAPATPFGNAIRKAYLCHSPTRLIPQGATLYFYRSVVSSGGRGAGGLQSVGVVERSIRTSDAERILSFVGRRTVYSAVDVAAMCEGGSEVLATLFRHDHYLARPVGLAELVAGDVLNGAPQSVTRIKSDKGRAWLAGLPSASR